MKLRQFHQSDAEALAHVYRDAATKIGREVYDAEQVRVWALYPDDMEEFRDRLSRGLTLVAQEEEAIVAFGQLDPMDHVAFIYCASGFSRRGIASAIYARLEEHAIACGVTTLTTDASRISRSFFEKKGFVVVATERPIRFGVEFERFQMKKKEANQTPEPTAPSGRGSS
jgi:putative acetyltransferase